MKVGDVVEWTSQAGGCTRTKRGEIVAVVPARTMPDTSKVSRYGGGMARGHESYLVKVPGKGTYWPRVAALRLVGRSPIDTLVEAATAYRREWMAPVVDPTMVFARRRALFDAIEGLDRGATS